MKAKCSGQARLVCRALPVVLGFLQYKNFTENETLSVRWKKGEKDSNVVGQVGSARPVLRHAIIVVCLLLGYWVGARNLKTA